MFFYAGGIYNVEGFQLVTCFFGEYGISDYVGILVCVNGSKYEATGSEGHVQSSREHLISNGIVKNSTINSCRILANRRVVCIINFRQATKVCGKLNDFEDCYSPSNDANSTDTNQTSNSTCKNIGI